MKNPNQLEELLFEALRSLSEPERRRAFLEAVGREDPDLRRRLEGLIVAAEPANSFFGEAASGTGDLKELLEELQAEERDARFLGSGAAAEAKRAKPGAESDPADDGLDLVGAAIGRYKVLQKIGEGGCGVVYMAEQEEPVRRRVALKIIKLGMDTKQVVARFEAERQALAIMDHPNIARVLDGGATDAGRPFFVMELVRGIKITEYCDENQLPTRARLELLIQVAQAVQHAHQKGIIHRDLKPSNILVTINDGVPVPKVIDFGIAKAIEGRLTDKTLFTAFEHLIGTPAYMSPEQALMTSLDVDTRSDIYSLGVLLYELLTGKTPFDSRALLAAGVDEMRRTIREKEPLRPSTWLSSLVDVELTATARRRATTGPTLVHILRGDLDWIVMKCLEKDRTRRYETANGLAKDIQRFLENEPVVARPPSRIYRLQKMVRRNQMAVVASAGVALSLLFGLAVSTWLFARETVAHAQALRAQRLAEQERAKADQQRIAAEHLLARERIDDAWAALGLGNYWGAMDAFTDALRLEQGDPQRAAVHRLRLASLEPLRPPLLRLWSVGSEVTCADIASGGEQIALASRAGGGGPAVRVLDLATGRQVSGPMSHTERINEVKFSPDGRRLVTASDDRTARVWDVGSGKPVTEPLRQPAPVTLASFSPDGSQVVLGSWQTSTFSTGSVAVVDIASQAVAYQLDDYGLNLSTAVFSSNHEVVLGCRSHRAAVAKVDHGQYWVVPDTWSMSAAVFPPAGRTVLLGGAFGPNAAEGGARLLDLETQDWAGPRLPHEGRVLAASFSPDGRRIATGATDRTARVWETERGQALTRPMAHLSSVLAVRFSHDGRRLLTVSADRTARVWDAETGQPITLPLPHAGAVLLAQFSPDDTQVWTVSSDGTVCAWAARPKLAPHHTLRHDTPVSAIRAGPQNAIITADRTQVSLWQPSDGNLIWQSLAAGSHDWLGVADWAGPRVLIHSPDQFWVLNVDSGEWLPGPNAGPGRSLTGIQFCPGGTHALVLPVGTSAVLEFDTVSGRVTRRFEVNAPLVVSTLSHDGEKLLAITDDGEACTWNFRTERLQQRVMLSSRINRPLWAKFSADNQRLLVLGAEHTLALWNATNLASAPLTFAHGALAAEFSKDGRWVVTGNSDGFARIYSANTGEVAVPALPHLAAVNQVQFSPDSQLVATSSEDDMARVWETATGQPVTPPLPHRAAVVSIGFGADSRSLLTGCWDGQGSVWELPALPGTDAELVAAYSRPSSSIDRARQWDPSAGFERTVKAWHDIHDLSGMARFPSRSDP
ncbi:MAG: protein kinase [Verrucomicrobiota bacterium]